MRGVAALWVFLKVVNCMAYENHYQYWGVGTYEHYGASCGFRHIHDAGICERWVEARSAE